MSNVLIDREKIDILANAISDKSGVSVTMTLDEMVEAVDGIEMEPNLQAKTYTVSMAGTETIEADNGYDGLSEVEVTVPRGSVRGLTSDYTSSNNGIGSYNGNLEVSAREVPTTPIVSEGYVSSVISSTRRVFVPTSIPYDPTITVSDDTVTILKGYYSSQTTKSVASGTAGTPTATKGAVSNHSISITPSVTNTTGWITGSTKTGTAVTVSASELVSGTYNVTSSGTKDVTNYASASVPSGTEGTPTATKESVSNHAISVTPSVTNTAGYISGGTKTGTAVSVSASELVYGTLTVSTSGTHDVTNYANISVADGSLVQLSIIGNTPTITIDGNGLITASVETKSGNIECVAGTRGGFINGGSTTPYYIWGTSATQQLTTRTSSDLTASGATVTVPSGYYSAQVSKSVATMTLPTTAASSATSGYASKATIGRSTAAQYINIPPGYNSTGAYYVITAVADGSATAPASISGTAASVSTGTNTLTLTKTVSVTPTVYAGYVSSGTAGNSSVSLTANITTKAAATYHPSTNDQTISASQYLTGTQTIKAVTITNLTAANIKKDVVVKIGDSTDDDCVTTITGTYEGSGGAALTVDTSTATLSSAANSISFTGLAGEPTSFAVVSAAELATGASPWKTAAVVFDGTDLHGQTIRNTSNAQVTYDGSSFSKTYSNGTLTITGSGTNFQANQYKLVYTYGGSDIGTADVQVGSGATSITFTGLEEEPSYFSCIFKSNFSTSSGYQRVIVVVYDGTSTYGMEMDSSAKHSTAHWTYSYSSGSLTITSSGTNAGGYFHQPGYYQLTYAVEGSGGNYQTKSATYYATSSQQTASIAADSGYDALKKVNITIAPVTTTNLIASNIVSGVTVQVGDAADSDRIASVTGNVVLQNYYTGSSAPSSSLGSNGDLYLQS